MVPPLPRGGDGTSLLSPGCLGATFPGEVQGALCASAWIAWMSLRVQRHDSNAFGLHVAAGCISFLRKTSLGVPGSHFPLPAKPAVCRQESVRGSVRERQRPTCLHGDSCGSWGAGSWYRGLGGSRVRVLRCRDAVCAGGKGSSRTSA